MTTTNAAPLVGAANRAPTGSSLEGYRLLWFAAPALVLYGLVLIYPTIAGAALAFTNSKGGRRADFVGLANFQQLLGDPGAIKAVGNSVLLTLSLVVVQTALALMLALGLHQKLKLRGPLRTVFFLPFIFPSLIVGVLWQYLYNPGGPIDSVLASIGLEGLIQLWLGNTSIALWSVIVALIWQNTGFSVVVYLAALEEIPAEIYEAGAIDGASGARTFWHITRPMLGPATTINLTLTMVGALKIFDQIFVMTNGGPGVATQVLSLFTYQQSFVLGNWGYGSAIALVLTMIIAAAAFVQTWARSKAGVGR